MGLERTWTQEQPRFILVSGKRFLNLHAELFAAFVPDPDNRIYLKYYLKRCQKIPRSEIALSPVHKVQFVEHKQQTNSSKYRTFVGAFALLDAVSKF